MDQSAAGRHYRTFALEDVLALIWQRKMIVFAVALACVLMMCVAMLIMKPVYRAQMQIVPTQNKLMDRQTIDVTSRVLGGLTGVDKAQPIDLYVNLFSTMEMADRLEREHGLLRKIFAGRWDAEHRRWMPRPGILASVMRAVRSVFGVSGSEDPSLEDLKTFIRSRLFVSPLSGEGIRVVTFRSLDRQLSLDMLRWLDEDSEDMLRQRDKTRYQSLVAYLYQALGTTDLVERRQSLLRLLEVQDQQLMLIGGDAQYAATIFESPYVDDKPDSPNPPVLLLIAVVGGLLLGLAVVTVPLMLGRGRSEI